MYQSSHRNNFLDALIEPTSIAILVSIALHAILGANLSLFTHPDREGKKADPGTVKVVELTPNELQRIPQAPPIPALQVPVTPPVVPSTKVLTPPTSLPLSPNSPTVPFSPLRLPIENVTPQSPQNTKAQKATPSPQPAAPVFDPKVSLKPTPKPAKPPAKNGTVTKLKPAPIPKPTPKPIAKKPKATTPDPLQTFPDDDGGNSPPARPTPTRPAQTPASSPTSRPPVATATNPTRPAGQSPTQPSGTPGSDGNSFPPFYGKYAAAATERIQQYLKAYPGIELYKPRLLSQSYPVGAPCSREKQSPFIVLMVAFDKVPENADNNPLGDSSAPSIDKPYVAAERDTPENRKLGELAVNTALYEANKADQTRPATDKGKRVLYQYRVQFDPTTCKK